MMALRFLFMVVFLCTRRLFFLRNRFREYIPAKIASIISNFEQILSERLADISKRSFKNHKNSKLACYPHN